MRAADHARTQGLVIHPSVSAYFNRGVSRIVLPLVAIAVVVYALEAVRDPGSEITLAAGVAILVLLGIAFFTRAEIAVQDGTLTYRRLVWRRRFSRESVGGLARRRLNLIWNHSASRPTQYAVVYGTDRRALFAFSAALWPDHDLLKLRQALGGDTSNDPLSAAELQAEFPGALPGWVVFYDSHPFWGIVIATPLMLAAIIVGILLWDAVKPR